MARWIAVALLVGGCGAEAPEQIAPAPLYVIDGPVITCAHGVEPIPLNDGGPYQAVCFFPVEVQGPSCVCWKTWVFFRATGDTWEAGGVFYGECH
jgi:hypothetical protein